MTGNSDMLYPPSVVKSLTVKLSGISFTSYSPVVSLVVTVVVGNAYASFCKSKLKVVFPTLLTESPKPGILFPSTVPPTTRPVTVSKVLSVKLTMISSINS